MKLSRKSQLSPEKRAELRRNVTASVGIADYSSALIAAEEAWSRFPNDFAVCCSYASMLGDYAEFCPPAVAKSLRKKSLRMMRSLLKRTQVEYDKQVIVYLKNEYYWQTKNRQAQYELGIQSVKNGDSRGYYSQGVGAAWRAFELAQGGQQGHADRWARLGIKAWRSYEGKHPHYYNQYVHRALAEGVLGLEEAMENSLRRAAELSHKHVDFSEFQEIRMLIGKLRRRRET